ncbi:hypothetical protein GQ53DRAFT_790362 [Thozetella sp. PMI_491]|nr:hypothetical protein GQ53DRAFT_790362 [Thozetella sp. PMI_491]
MSYASRYYKPALRQTVDVQLQTAFSDGNWPTVVRLAEQRFRTLKDPYFEAIKHCAQSQLDTANDTFAALVAVQELVQSKPVIDSDVLDLYEWAILDLKPFSPEQYAATLGTLRVRWVKANPKSSAAVQCLEACVRRWDLVSAQQIAVALDKAHATSKDHRYMFWSIALTYLLSESDQAAESNRKLYGMLSLKQLQRAAELTEAAKANDSTVRGLLSEEEVYLYYHVLLKAQSVDEAAKLVKSPRLGVLQQLQDGRQVLFSDTIDALQSWKRWDLAFEICLGALNSIDKGVKSSMLSSNWTFWKVFVQAAGKTSDPEAAAAHVEAALAKFLSGNVPLNAMQRKNLGLVLLERTFRIPQAPPPQGEGSRLPVPVAQLVRFLTRQSFSPSALEDIKVYLDLLSLEDTKALLDDALPKIREQVSQGADSLSLEVLEHKIRYFISTSPRTLSPRHLAVGDDQSMPYQCQICSSATTDPCMACLQKLVTASTKTYKKLMAEEGAPSSYRQDVALVIAMSLLKLAGLKERAAQTQPSLQVVNKSLFLQGVLVLDSHVKRNTGDIGARILLSQLYLLLGCATLAYQTWVPLDIKRTIQDSLSPLFFDRISTISPGLFQGSRPLMEPLRSYYNNVLQNNAPVKIWDAFSSGSYHSIVGVVEYDKALRRSCTLAMTLVEERRATRAFGGKLEDEIKSNPLLQGIGSNTTLVNSTKYGPIPNFESSHVAPIHDLVRFGPELSSERCHLALLTEQYLDLITLKPPKEFKPVKANEIGSKYLAYTADSLTSLQHHLSSITNRIAWAKLTTSEHMYYNAICQLVTLLLVSLKSAPGGAAPELISTLAASVRLTLGELQAEAHDCAADPFQALSSMHVLSTYRDAAFAARHTAAFALAHHEREVARDRSGKSGLHKEAVAEMKVLDAVAGKALGLAKGWIKGLKDLLGEGGWLDRMLEWMFQDDAEADNKQKELGQAVEDMVEGRSEAEDWASRVVESWGEGVRGWGMIRWE